MTVTATIKRITEKGRYRRVHFTAEDGTHCLTDLVPTFRNYQRWEPLLEVGNKLTNLVLMDTGKIDGDSHPELVQPEPDPQMEFEL
jgi:hypothetical protein